MVTQELVNCIDAKQCIVMTLQRYYWDVAFYIIASISLLIIILIFWRTPAYQFLKAWMTGKPLILLTNRSQQGRIRAVSSRYEGTLDVRGSGTYILSENSHIIEKTTGKPIYLAFGEFAATIPLWWVQIINKIKRKFTSKEKSISNVEDVGGIVGMKFNHDAHKWEKTDAKVKNQDMKIIPYLTVKLHDLVNMFPFNITPAMIESKVIHALAKKQKFWNTMNPQFMISAGILLFILIIGTIIAYKFVGGGAPEVKVTIDQAGRIISQNMTG